MCDKCCESNLIIKELIQKINDKIDNLDKMYDIRKKPPQVDLIKLYGLRPSSEYPDYEYIKTETN
jgi:hypothetical protein